MKRPTPAKAEGYLTLSAISIFLLINIMSIGQGLQHRFLNVIPNYYAYVSLVFFITLLLLSYSVLRILRAHDVEAQVSEWLGLAMMSASFVSNLYLKSYALQGVPWWLLGFGTVAAAIAAYMRWKSRGAIYVFLGAGSTFLLLLYFTMPAGGDMLMTVAAAGKEFLSGKQPYRAYPEIYPEQGFEFSRNLVLTYLPGLWLSYLPAVAFGFNLKLINVMALVFFIVLFERILPVQQNRATLLALVFYPFILSHLLFFAVINVHTWLYWVLLSGLLLGLVYNRYLAAAICLGVAFATRQSALFLAGPILAYMLMRVNYRKIVFYTAIAICTFILICLPFAYNWPYEKGFIQHLFLRFTSLADDPYLVYKISAAWYLSYFGIVGWATWIQVTIIALTMVLVRILSISDAARFSLLLGVMFLWLVFFNPYAVPYVYYPGMIFIAIGLVLLPKRSANSSGS